MRRENEMLKRVLFVLAVAAGFAAELAVIAWWKRRKAEREMRYVLFAPRPLPRSGSVHAPRDRVEMRLLEAHVNRRFEAEGFRAVAMMSDARGVPVYAFDGRKGRSVPAWWVDEFFGVDCKTEKERKER